MAVSVDNLMKDTSLRLEKAGVSRACDEARLIIKRVMGDDKVPGQGHLQSIEQVVRLRESRMPVERIFGEADFCGLKIKTKAGVFRPYAETQDVVDFAARNFSKDQPLRILDLGTGTGCLLLALLQFFPKATGVGIDIEWSAIDLAKENARALGLDSRVDFRSGDWSAGIKETFDLIISNPPQVASADLPYLVPEMRNHEPRKALDGGSDGMHFFRLLANDLQRLGNDNAIGVCQVGPRYAARVAQILKKSGFASVRINNDAMGLPCCVTIRKSPDPKSASPISCVLNWMVGGKR